MRTYKADLSALNLSNLEEMLLIFAEKLNLNLKHSNSS